MTLLRILGAAIGVAATLTVAAPALADSFSFQYGWTDGRGWGGPPRHRGRHDDWKPHRHHHRPAPMVRDRFGRPLGYLVPSPYGPMVVERPYRHRPPPPTWGWGPRWGR
ncbi:hypothetical protein [Azospirillum sp. A39]|uniref:hypothetical protein n=1 Tax=Azospirillum sp. A39 TaxID=3462279 RepID=UPI0040452AD9